jgi:hypothetical protein
MHFESRFKVNCFQNVPRLDGAEVQHHSLDPQSNSPRFHSETAPTEGTLKVFPDILLSNAYIIFRPFFRPLVSSDSADYLDAKNWEFGKI